MSSVEIFVPSDSPLSDEALQALTSKLGEIEIRNVPRTSLARILMSSRGARKSLSQYISELTLKEVCQGYGGYLVVAGNVITATAIPGAIFIGNAAAAGGGLATFLCTTFL